MATNPNLRSVIRIKTMARAAIPDTETVHSDTAWEMAKAYERLREEARKLSENAGWDSGDEFDAEMPPIRFPEVPGNARPLGRRARVLLGQLAGWAEGHQEAFELEARFKADAEAKQRAAAEAQRPTPGFR